MSAGMYESRTHPRPPTCPSNGFEDRPGRSVAIRRSSQRPYFLMFRPSRSARIRSVSPWMLLRMLYGSGNEHQSCNHLASSVARSHDRRVGFGWVPISPRPARVVNLNDVRADELSAEHTHANLSRLN